MSMLIEGIYELSSAEGRVSGDKTVIFVKLTDSALKSIEECVPNDRKTVLKPAVQFYSANGVLKLPNRGNYNKSYGFTLSSVEGEGSQGSFECLHLRETESLESLGCMLLKMQINAKEDTYEKTRVKMAAVEKENKKFCTKEIDASSPYVGKKVKIKRPITPVALKVGFQPYKYDRMTQRAALPLSLGLGNRVASPIDELLSEKTIVDHSLEDETRKKNYNSKDYLDDGNTTHSIPFEADNMLTEKRNPVDSDFHVHIPYTKKKRISEKHGLMVEVNDDVGSSGTKQCSSDNSWFEMQTVDMKTDPWQESTKCLSSNSNENEKRVSDNSLELDMVLESDDDEIPVEDTECENEMNILKSDHYEMPSKLNDGSNITLEDLTEQEWKSSLNAKSSSDAGGASTSIGICCDVDLNKEQCVQSLGNENDQSFPSLSLNCQEMETVTLKGNPDFSENLSSPLEYTKFYTDIISQQQREQYKADFDAEYEQYKVLHDRVKQATMKFASLENDLKRYRPGSEEHVRIKERIYQEYFLNANDQTYQKAKKKLHFLHGKLSHIKRLVMEYDQAHTMT